MVTVITFAAGYVACIIFPVPGVSRWVLDRWVKLGARLKG